MDGMDYLKSKIDHLSESLSAKDVQIADLENKVENLENKLDVYEQYSRRSNLRFLGIEEISDDQLEGTVIDIVNKQMCVSTAPGRRYRSESQSQSEAPVYRDKSPSPRAREIPKQTSPR